jgi:hypothetical protein
MQATTFKHLERNVQIKVLRANQTHHRQSAGSMANAFAPSLE